MVYSDQNHYIVTSAACGPAFEGGHMKCGIGAVAGAVDKVWYDQRLNRIPYASRSTSSWCLRKWVYFLACDIVKERCLAEKRLYGA